MEHHLLYCGGDSLVDKGMDMTEKGIGVHWQRSVVTLTNTVLVVITLAALYFVREVFIPLALALFFAFLLYPPVRWLQRHRVPRHVAVITVVLCSLLLVGVGGWVVSRQVRSLVVDLPNYSQNITSKLTTLREMTVGSERWQEFIDELNGVLHQNKVNGVTTEKEDTLTTPNTPSRVVVEPESPRWLSWLTSHASSAISPFTQLLLALVLVIFILLNREDLINRLLRLVGREHASFTSKAVQEAGSKMSNFLLTQLLVNSAFGGLLAIILLLIGVNYALLWGFLATLLRYIPYVGAFMAAFFPLTLSLAQFDGWWQPLMVMGAFVTLELIVSNAVEPLLYGKNIGVSEVALLLAAAFWAWMWGAVGLILSTPLTLVLVTIGKYVPQLNYLTVLLGDEPVLSPDMNLYQRLISRDQDEAEHIIEAQLSEKNPAMIFDQLLVPALHHLKQDQAKLNHEDAREVQEMTRELLESISSEVPADESDSLVLPTPFKLLGIPARDVNDQLSMEMFKQILDGRKWNLEVAGHEVLSSEVALKATESKVRAICLGSIPPGGTARCRYLCKRLRAQFPEVKILVGIWAPEPVPEDKIKLLQDAGADWVGSSLLEARDQLQVWLPIWTQQQAKVA